MTGAPRSSNRLASSGVWAHTPLSPAYAGPDNQASRCALSMLFSLIRALTNTMGILASLHCATQLGHTSVSSTTAKCGSKCLRNFCTMAGVSQGCQTCTSSSFKRDTPKARPVAVPWVKTMRILEYSARNACSKTSAARVSPKETACTQMQVLEDFSS